MQLLVDAGDVGPERAFRHAEARRDLLVLESPVEKREHLLFTFSQMPFVTAQLGLPLKHPHHPSADRRGHWSSPLVELADGFQQLCGGVVLSKYPVAPGASNGWVGGASENGKFVGTAFGGSIDGEVPVYFDGKNWTFLKVVDQYGIESKRVSPHGVNNKGTIVGWYFDSQGQQHGFMRDGSTVTTLDGPTAAEPEHPGTAAFKVNNEGDVVGDWAQFNHTLNWFDYHGFIYRSGRMLTYDVPGIPPGNTVLFSINDKGQVIGLYYDPNLNWATVGFVGSPAGN